MQVVTVTTEHLNDLAELTCCLWPTAAPSARLAELTAQLSDSNLIFFLVYDEKTAVAFAECALRHDYVEGSQSSPVGYLEGIFVREEHRKNGVGRLLLQRCMDWSRQCGCSEFASNCELGNTQSLHFHLHAGFSEAGRTINFLRKL